MIDQFACGHLHQPFDCADIAISVDEIATPLPLPLAIISTENMSFNTPKIDITQMLSAFHNVFLHICALPAAAIEEDTLLNVLLP